MRRSWARSDGKRYVPIAREAPVILIMRLTPGRENWHPVTSEIPLEAWKTIDADSKYMGMAGYHAVSAVEDAASKRALLAEGASISVRHDTSAPQVRFKRG